MAKYTVDDFNQKLKETGFQFSDQDMKLALSNPDAGMSLISAKQDWQSATTSAARALANAQAEKIRSEFGGYTGGTSGTGYNLNTPNQTYNIQNLADTIANRGEFQFDPDTNPLVQAYNKQYHREGQRAAADTLGTVAAATGGMPSSYATTAAAQANNYYAAQAADKLPEIQNMLFGQYVQNGQLQQGDLSALLGVAGLANDQANAQAGMEQFAWQKDLAERQFAAEQANNAWEQQYKAALAKANAGDYSALNALLNISGGTTGAAGATGTTGSNSSTSSSSSSSRTPSVSYDNGGYSTEQIKALQRALGVTADGQFGPQSQAAMKALGYTSISQAMNALGSGNTQNFFNQTQEYVKNAVANANNTPSNILGNLVQKAVSAAEKAAATQAQRRADSAGGVVQSQADWNAMVKLYGEGAVKAAYRMK